MKHHREINNIFYLIFILMIGVLFVRCAEKPVSESSVAEELKDSLKNSGQVLNQHNEPLKTIEDIQKAYSDVESKIQKNTLDSVVFTYNCHDEKRGTISYFTEEGNLQLIVHRYSEYDHFSSVDRYYVRDSTLFFVYTNGVAWAFDDGPEGSTKDNITEKRTYLIQEKAVKCLEKKYIIYSKANNNKKPEAIPNREIACALTEKILKPYLQLLEFRDKVNKDCLN